LSTTLITAPASEGDGDGAEDVCDQATNGIKAESNVRFLCRGAMALISVETSQFFSAETAGQAAYSRPLAFFVRPKTTSR